MTEGHNPPPVAILIMRSLNPLVHAPSSADVWIAAENAQHNRQADRA